MKKKIFLILCMCLCLLGMTACSKTDPTTEDYNGYTYDDLKNVAQNTITTLMSLTDEDKMNYLASGQETTVNLITRWDEACDGVGAYLGFKDFTVTRSGKVLTAEQEVEFEERPVLVTFVYTYHTMELDDVNINAVQSLGEKMSNAGMNTLMGIGTVFIILILISLIIYAFRIIPYLAERKKSPEPQIKQVPVTEQIAVRENRQDDLELAAVIAAAIAAATNTSTDDFVVRSIRRR